MSNLPVAARERKGTIVCDPADPAFGLVGGARIDQNFIISDCRVARRLRVRKEGWHAEGSHSLPRVTPATVERRCAIDMDAESVLETIGFCSLALGWLIDRLLFRQARRTASEMQLVNMANEQIRVLYKQLSEARSEAEESSMEALRLAEQVAKDRRLLVANGIDPETGVRVR